MVIIALRPALAALAEQQKIIDGQVADITKLKRQVAQLTRGLAAVAKLTGNDIPVRTAIFKRADEQNPAQPVPDPAGEPPTQTTLEAEQPEAFADVRAPGLVPGTNNDTAADAVSTAYTPGQDIPSPAINELVDVTRPVDGTQSARPLSETKTLVDVRVADPMNPQVAFPTGGPFANAQRTSSVDDSRAVASLRLAKLRIATGTSDSDDEVVVMNSLVHDASLSNDAIARETATLEKVRKASSSQVDAPRNLVPRTATVRTVPQLTRQARNELAGDDLEAQDLFLGSDL